MELKSDFPCLITFKVKNLHVRVVAEFSNVGNSTWNPRYMMIAFPAPRMAVHRNSRFPDHAAVRKMLLAWS